MDERDRADMARLAAGQDAPLNDLMERHAGKLFNYLIRASKARKTLRTRRRKSSRVCIRILNCSAKAVETRLYRARQQLRTALGPLLESI